MALKLCKSAKHGFVKTALCSKGLKRAQRPRSEATLSQCAQRLRLEAACFQCAQRLGSKAADAKDDSARPRCWS